MTNQDERYTKANEALSRWMTERARDAVDLAAGAELLREFTTATARLAAEATLHLMAPLLEGRADDADADDPL